MRGGVERGERVADLDRHRVTSAARAGAPTRHRRGVYQTPPPAPRRGLSPQPAMPPAPSVGPPKGHRKLPGSIPPGATGAPSSRRKGGGGLGPSPNAADTPPRA